MTVKRGVGILVLLHFVGPAVLLSIQEHSPEASSLHNNLCDNAATLHSRPYNQEVEDFLRKKYLLASPDVKLLYAQTGSCRNFVDCPFAMTTFFTLCRFFNLMMACGGQPISPNGIWFMFDECRGGMCRASLSSEATKCVIKTWHIVNPEYREMGSCVPRQSLFLLNTTRLRVLEGTLNGTHCLLPFPRGSEIWKKIKCTDANEPEFHFWLPFERPLSPNNYSCGLVSKCDGLGDTLDFMCIEGNDSAEHLRSVLFTPTQHIPKFQDTILNYQPDYDLDFVNGASGMPNSLTSLSLGISALIGWLGVLT